MEPARFQAIAQRYSGLRIAVVGDFCLDRYLEIDPARQEISLETGLPVHNVINVRAQPGGAGTILNNLSALGIGDIYSIGFIGDDGEGFELWRALENRAGVRMKYFVKTSERHTFSYCKPLVLAPSKPPVELNRLDLKNWTPTPEPLQELLIKHLRTVADLLNAIVVLDQVDLPETGVVTQKILGVIEAIAKAKPELVILADSRRGLGAFPPVKFKMNAAELRALADAKNELNLDEIKAAAAALAGRNGQPVFVTLAERGLLGAMPDGVTEHVPALPVRGEIDIVGAGDAVTANLTAALAAGADLRESLEIANAAASVAIHKLGTTGTASIAEIAELLEKNA